MTRSTELRALELPRRVDADRGSPAHDQTNQQAGHRLSEQSASSQWEQGALLARPFLAQDGAQKRHAAKE